MRPMKLFASWELRVRSSRQLQSTDRGQGEGDFLKPFPSNMKGESAAICVLIRHIAKKEAQNSYFGNGCEI